MYKKDNGHVLGGIGMKTPNVSKLRPATTTTGQGQDEAAEQVSQLMRGLCAAASTGFEVSITNTEADRTDSIQISTRSWTVATLKNAYRESILKKRLSKLNERWFNYTDIVLSHKDEVLDDKYTLSRYGIRPGSTLVAACTPKVKITIRNQAGQKKAYQVEGSCDWTIQKLKEEYTKVRRELAPHDWTADDIALMDNDGILIDDSGKLSDFGVWLKDNRGNLTFKVNYRKNGISYARKGSDELGNVSCESNNSAFGRMTTEQLDSVWDNPSAQFDGNF